jgi:hypothetical protein
MVREQATSHARAANETMSGTPQEHCSDAVGDALDLQAALVAGVVDGDVVGWAPARGIGGEMSPVSANATAAGTPDAGSNRATAITRRRLRGGERY